MAAFAIFAFLSVPLSLCLFARHWLMLENFENYEKIKRLYTIKRLKLRHTN